MANEIPNPLPSVLPVGTRGHCPWNRTHQRHPDGDFWSTSELRLEKGRYVGDFKHRDGSEHQGASADPETIIWNSLSAPPATPPDVAAPGDRLFDGVGVCCLCGVDGAHHVRGSDCPIPGARYCNRRPCLSASYSIRKIDAEITRRRALQTPPAPEKWEPKVGEMCEGDRMGDLIRGPYRRNDVDGWPILLMQEGPPGMHLYVPIEQRVKPGSLRPTTLEKPATAPKGEGERKADPYENDGLRPAEHDMAACTVPMNDMRRDERISALSTGDELSQLAARRQRQRGALLEAMDDGKARREAVRHPSDWDVSDAPECYSTHGSGR